MERVDCLVLTRGTGMTDLERYQARAAESSDRSVESTRRMVAMMEEVCSTLLYHSRGSSLFSFFRYIVIV